MSRTIRRGKPSRNFHKYIGLGIIDHENRRWYHKHALGAQQGHLYWKDGVDDPTTYEEYTNLKIRRYHMDFRPWNKCPNEVHRMDIQLQKRRIKALVNDAIRTGDYDVVLPPMGSIGHRIWEWW